MAIGSVRTEVKEREPSQFFTRLHLRPCSNLDQRIWQFGSLDSKDYEHFLIVGQSPTGLETFSYIKQILIELLEQYDDANLEEAIRRLEMASYHSEDDASALLNDSVAFAALRRISRESVYTSNIIDFVAKVLNGHRPLSTRGVIFNRVDSADRPSIKILARAMLLAEPSDKIVVWQFNSDPREPRSEHQADLARASLFQYIDSFLSPKVVIGSQLVPSRLPVPLWSERQIASALVMQNYDGVLIASEGAEDPEVLRLRSIANVNLGSFDEALHDLSCAEKLAGPGLRAQLSYLRGLILAKRTYDRHASDASFRAGLAILDEYRSTKNDGDFDLERAWLLNGLALNVSLAWTKGVDHQNLVQASSLERQAFELVRIGTDNARAYLRFNLIANTTFLLEMQGYFTEAANVFESVFQTEIPDTKEGVHRLGSTVGYRIGVLRLKAGDRKAARQLLTDALAHDIALGGICTTERILRAKGLAEFEDDDFQASTNSHRQGLRISRECRSYDGCLEHLRSLHKCSAHVSDGDLRQEIESCAKIEGISKAEYQALPKALSPKLPAYVPEVDLEGIPMVDLNRLLVGAK